MSDNTKTDDAKAGEPVVHFPKPKRAYAPKKVTEAAAAKAEARPQPQVEIEPPVDTRETALRVEDTPEAQVLLRTDSRGVNLHAVAQDDPETTDSK